MGKGRDKRKRRLKKQQQEAPPAQSRFTAAAAPRGSFDVDAAIAEFKTEFPEDAGRVFILNTDKFDTPSAAVSTINNMLKAASGSPHDLLDSDMKTLGEYVSQGRAVSINAPDDRLARQPRVVLPSMASVQDNMKMMFSIAPGKPESGFPAVPKTLDNAMWQQFALDHELGHAVGGPKAGKRDPYIEEVNFNECIADAYATIRHFQRYGGDSDFPNFVADMRNAAMVVGNDPGHFSVAAIERVMELNAAGALDGLSPKQCIAKAVEIAHDVGLQWPQRKELTDDYGDTVKKFTDETTIETVRRVAGIGYRTKSETVFKSAKRFLDSAPGYFPAGTLDRDALGKSYAVMMDGETAKLVTSKLALQSRFSADASAGNETARPATRGPSFDP